MDVIHFTRGATDPLDSGDARGISSPERIAGQTCPSDLLLADRKAQS